VAQFMGQCAFLPLPKLEASFCHSDRTDRCRTWAPVLQNDVAEISQRHRVPGQHTFLGVSALLFASSTAVTIVWSSSMSEMGDMPMPGGWTMSMAWRSGSD